MTNYDKYTTRKAKLVEIIKREGSQISVAKKIGADKSYLSQIVSPKGNRNVGDALARKIEDAYHQAYGWMDKPMENMPHEKLTSLDHGLAEFVLIPRYHAEASMGEGAETYGHDELSGHLAFKNIWLQKRRLNPKFLTIIDAIGDSMHPTINDGDVLLVDLRQKEPVDNRIFVLRMNQQLYAKRLQFRPDSKLVVHSDNPHSPAFDVDLAQHNGLDIIGRVVWAGRDL